jgi:alpha-1,2-mannosyltransferase
MEALTGALLLCWAFVSNLSLYVFMPVVHFGDFGRFYYSAQSWRQGHSMYAATPATVSSLGVHYWNLSPPHLTLLFYPFTWMPIGAAYIVWSAVTVLALVLAARMILDELHLQQTWSRKFLLFAFVSAATPTIAYAATGHITGLVTLLVTGIWRALRREQFLLAGGAIGLAIGARLFFAPLLIYLILGRQWRSAAVAAATAAGCFVVGIAIFGLAEHHAWLAALGSSQGPWAVMNSSFTAPLARVPYIMGGRRPDASVAWAVRLGGGISVIALAAGLGLSRRRFGKDASVLLVLLTCLLASPFGWLYYWWMMAGPLAGAWTHRSMRVAFWLSLPAWLVPWSFFFPFSSIGQAVTIGSLYFWGLLALWVGAARVMALPPAIRTAP